MNAHIVGQGQFSEKNGTASSVHGNSWAVVQFVELVRGEKKRIEPCNSFRVVEVATEEHYCMKCWCIRWFDVVYAEPASFPGRAERMRCRKCGKEGVGW